jgi:hypothetical protein
MVSRRRIRRPDSSDDVPRSALGSRSDRWTELKPQLERHDHGNSHMRMLDTYLRMLAEYRRIMDTRERGFSRTD